ncbi:PREDICTED: thionin-like protein 2 [Camelina sativa]|uniref:Thionin-like protein 2 n=1 Tax=Camelina sativa TaxID=90675 RepID=A0ABM0XVG2_CAMSA|nr:PREDICTED: thionin-like protein 2 [Camelina sativa]
MEGKRMTMLIVITLVMIIGNLMTKTEAIPFNRRCYPVCLRECKYEERFLEFLKCPFKCMKTCLQPPSLSSKIIHDSEYFCKLGCASHCVPRSSLQNPNVKRVSACVESCSNKCTKKCEK